MRFLDDMNTHYTAQNGRLPDTPSPRVIASGTANDGPVHVYLHGARDAEAEQPDPSRRPAMREPGLDPNNEALADLAEQVAALNIAVARMAQGQGMGLPDDDPDQVGEGEANQFPDDPSDPGDILSQVASNHANSSDALPDDPQSINAKNAAHWQGKGGTTTGGSQSLPPSSRKAESGGYLPNATGSINTNRRLSTTAKVAEAQGRTWGTSDRAAMQRANFWRDQRLATNKAIGKIQQTLQTRWGR